MLPNNLIAFGLVILGFVFIVWSVLNNLKRHHQGLQPTCFQQIFQLVSAQIGFMLVIWTSSFLIWDALQRLPHSEQLWLLVLVFFVGLLLTALAYIISKYLKIDLSTQIVGGRLILTTQTPLTRLPSRIMTFCLFIAGFLLITDDFCLLVLVLINWAKL